MQPLEHLKGSFFQLKKDGFWDSHVMLHFFFCVLYLESCIFLPFELALQTKNKKLAYITVLSITKHWWKVGLSNQELKAGDIFCLPKILNVQQH